MPFAVSVISSIIAMLMKSGFGIYLARFKLQKYSADVTFCLAPMSCLLMMYCEFVRLKEIRPVNNGQVNL